MDSCFLVFQSVVSFSSILFVFSKKKYLRIDNIFVYTSETLFKSVGVGSSSEKKNSVDWVDGAPRPA